MCRDPDNKRSTWSGRGRTLRWLAQKTKCGRSVADFLIPVVQYDNVNHPGFRRHLISPTLFRLSWLRERQTIGHPMRYFDYPFAPFYLLQLKRLMIETGVNAQVLGRIDFPPLCRTQNHVSD